MEPTGRRPDAALEKGRSPRAPGRLRETAAQIEHALESFPALVLVPKMSKMSGRCPTRT
jgi:hypothetical protein